MKSLPKAQSPREAAVHAIVASWQEECFLHDWLEKWSLQALPSPRDYALALEIASGTVRMRTALEAMAKQLTPTHRLKVSRLERAILLSALYQRFYLDRIPNYALVDGAVSLAHQLSGNRFARFVNGLLRGKAPLRLPIADFATRLSFPNWFVEQLIADYGREITLQILHASNAPPTTMARHRITKEVEIIERDQLQNIAKDQNYYIQNRTPANLIHQLAAHVPKPPSNILDLCAAPGGKLIALHDRWPKASLVANDLSESRIKRLESNLHRYGIRAQLHCGPGQTFIAEQPFELIVLDLPCSNSGVLARRPEARWRLNSKAIDQLLQLQQKLIQRAVELLVPGGQLWLMTCSILKAENEKLSQWACESFSLEPLSLPITHLPDRDGSDGGFGCAFRSSVD